MKNRARHRFAIALAISLAVQGCSSVGALPPLPPEPSQSSPAVREQFHRAFERLQKDSKDAAANGHLGMLFHAYRLFEPAETCYQRAATLDSHSFTWVYYLGVVQAAWGKQEAAIASMERALRLRPGDPQAETKLAELLQKTGRIRESRLAYERALARHPRPVAALYGLGRLLAEQTDHVSASQRLREAVELAPGFSAAHYALAQSYRALGDTARAEEHFEKYRRDPQGLPPNEPLLKEVDALLLSPVAFAAKAAGLAAAGKWKEAGEQYEQALAIDPRYEPAHTGLIGVYWRDGQWQKAEEHYKAALAIDPNSASCRFHFARILRQLQRRAEAERALEEAVRIDPRFLEAHMELGLLLEDQNRGPEATRRYRSAVAVNGEHREARFLLGRRLLIEGRAPEAIDMLLGTIKTQDEKTAQYMVLLASAYARTGNKDRARFYYRQAVERAAVAGQSGLAAQAEKGLRALEGAAGKGS